jgi:hypothetical protein
MTACGRDNAARGGRGGGGVGGGGCSHVCKWMEGRVGAAATAWGRTCMLTLQILFCPNALWLEGLLASRRAHNTAQCSS